MADAADPTIQAMLAAARAEFGARLPSKVAEIDALVERAAWDDARRAVHKLRGSAATYGFAALGAAAATAEDLLIQSGGAPDEAARARLADLLRVARAEAERAAPEKR